jgi:hypothetical protein
MAIKTNENISTRKCSTILFEFHIPNPLFKKWSKIAFRKSGAKSLLEKVEQNLIPVTINTSETL